MASQETKQIRICDDCAHGEWDMKFPNLDVWQKPTLLHCPYQKYAVIRGSQACEHFAHKEQAKK
jgi:hypothetical protein